jgi:transcription initiation factor TFIID subunit 1
MTGPMKPQTMQLKRPTNSDEEFHSIFPVENEELVYGRWEDEVIWDHEKMPVKVHPKMVSIDPNDDNIILGIPEDIDPATLPQEGPIKKVKIIQKHVKKSRMMLNRLVVFAIFNTDKIIDMVLDIA